MKDREEARHWIELEHTGENEGAGVVKWGADENARYGARTKGLEIHTQALNFLEQTGNLTPEKRSEVPTASYKRLLGTPEVRAKIGIELVDGKMLLLADPKLVAKALLYVAEDLASGKTKTEAIYTKSHRIAYANSLPPSVVVKLTQKPGEGKPVGGKPPASKPKKSPKPKGRVKRDILIPRDCIMNVTDNRVADVEDELRNLSLDSFTNAVSVLSRVFLELSVDCYIINRSLPATPGLKLRGKLHQVLDDLILRAKLNAAQAKPLRTALQKNSYLAPSIDMMNAYVHSADVFPSPTDLRANWDTLQPFFIALWAI